MYKLRNNYPINAQKFITLHKALPTDSETFHKEIVEEFSTPTDIIRQFDSPSIRMDLSCPCCGFQFKHHGFIDHWNLVDPIYNNGRVCPTNYIVELNVEGKKQYKILTEFKFNELYELAEEIEKIILDKNENI